MTRNDGNKKGVPKFGDNPVQLNKTLAKPPEKYKSSWMIMVPKDKKLKMFKTTKLAMTVSGNMEVLSLYIHIEGAEGEAGAWPNGTFSPIWPYMT
jgi:hypothetical protein